MRASRHREDLCHDCVPVFISNRHGDVVRETIGIHNRRPAELRTKTDRDLVSIIDNALEVGLQLAANGPKGGACFRSSAALVFPPPKSGALPVTKWHRHCAADL
jgi:hypothetical protein